MVLEHGNSLVGKWQLTIEENDESRRQAGKISSRYGIRSYYSVDAPEGLTLLQTDTQLSRKSSAVSVRSDCPSCSRLSTPHPSRHEVIKHISPFHTLTPLPSAEPNHSLTALSQSNHGSARSQRGSASFIKREQHEAGGHNIHIMPATAPETYHDSIGSENIKNKERKARSLPELTQSGYLTANQSSYLPANQSSYLPAHTKHAANSDMHLPHISQSAMSLGKARNYSSLTTSLPALPISIRKSSQPAPIFLIQKNPAPSSPLVEAHTHHYYDEHGNEIYRNTDYKQGSYQSGNNNRYPYVLPPLTTQSEPTRINTSKTQRQFRMHVFLEFGRIRDEKKASQLPDSVLHELANEYGKREVAEVVIIRRNGDYTILTRPQRRSAMDGQLLKHYKSVEESEIEYDYENERFEDDVEESRTLRRV